MSAMPVKNQPLDITAEADDHDDELWIVSYADMVTLLFGFFVILYSFSSLDEKKFDQMSEKMAEAFKAKSGQKSLASDTSVSDEERQMRALQMLVAMLNLGDNVEEAISKIESSYAEGKAAYGTEALVAAMRQKHDKSLIDQVEKSQKDDLQVIELSLPATTLFPSGGFRLTPEATAKLQGLADDLRKTTNLAEIEVVGHTDSQPPGWGAAYDNNFTLSSLRAGAVASTLIRFGVEPQLLSVRGMGSLKPLLPERDMSGRLLPSHRAKNRRVAILLKMRRAHVP